MNSEVTNQNEASSTIWEDQRRLSPILAYLLLIGGYLGVILYTLLIISILVFRPIWVREITHSASQVSGEIQEVTKILSLTEGALSLSAETLQDTSDLLVDTSEFIQESKRLLRSVGEVVGEEAPMTIQSTQHALEAAQSGSQAIDTMLKGLSVLEPITGFSYDPEKSLSQSLEEVASGLEPLPETLREVQSQLNQVADELAGVQPSLKEVSEDLVGFSERMEALSSNMKAEVGTLEDIPEAFDNFNQRVASISWISTIILCVFLILGVISHFSVILVGKHLRM